MSNKIASNRNNISGHLKYVGVDPECGGVEGGSSSECAFNGADEGGSKLWMWFPCNMN